MRSHFLPGLFSSRTISAIALLLGLSCGVADINGQEIRPESLLPRSTVLYVAMDAPPAAMASVLDHSVSKQIQSLDVYQKATQSQEYRNFLTGRKFFELQIGAEWRAAIEALSAKGIYGGFDAETKGGVLLVRGKDEETLENFRTKILELTRLSGGETRPTTDYKGVAVYRLPEGGAAVFKDWLIVTNKGDLGKQVIDRIVATPDEKQESLADNPVYQQASQTRAASQVWSFVDLGAIRSSGGAQKVFEGQAENPLAELIVGGIQSVLQHADWVTSDLSVSEQGLTWNFTSPLAEDWIPEQRQYYFGPANSGQAPALPEVADTLLTLSAYRDVSAMWVRAGDLFNEQMNDKLAEADAGLSTIFAGKDFGEEILGSFAPEIGVVVVRQDFAAVKPTPALRLPAFALVLKLKDPETMRAELRRTFQSAIGFFNIVGAQNGNPQLEMDMQKVGETDLITSRYLPEKKDRDSTTAPIIYNFSPSVSFTGDRFVLASTAQLAEKLGTAPLKEGAKANTAVELHADVLRDALVDNREQLVTQNMLTEGNSREEAEAAVGLLLEVMNNFKGAGLHLKADKDRLSLQFRIDTNSAAR
ncbi:MAG: DUF3352 domain-containing protein [Planctomycetaceae bacterium]